MGDRVPGTARSQGKSAPSSTCTELSCRCVSKGPRRTPCEYHKLAHRPGTHQPTPGGCVQSQTWASPGHTRDWLWHTGHTAGAKGLRGVSPGEQKQILVIIRPPPVRGWGQHPPGTYILRPVSLPTSDVVPGPGSRLAAFRTVTTDRTRVKDTRRQGGSPLHSRLPPFPLPVAVRPTSLSSSRYQDCPKDPRVHEPSNSPPPPVLVKLETAALTRAPRTCTPHPHPVRAPSLLRSGSLGACQPNTGLPGAPGARRACSVPAAVLLPHVHPPRYT